MMKTLILLLMIPLFVFGQSTKKVTHSDWVKTGAIYGYPDSTNMPAGPMRDSVLAAQDSAAAAIVLYELQLARIRQLNAFNQVYGADGMNRGKAKIIQSIKSPSAGRNVVRIVTIGDSHVSSFTPKLAESMRLLSGFAGFGLDNMTTSIFSDYVNIVKTSGWLTYDQYPDDQHWGISGYSFRGGATDTLLYRAGNNSIPTDRVDSARIWFYRASKWGTFQYRINDSSKVLVSANSGDSLSYVQFPLQDRRTNDIYITDITDSVLFYGIETFTNSVGKNGTIVDNLGNGSTKASEWVTHMEIPKKFIARVSPDYVIVQAGANDAGVDATTAAVYIGYMRTIVDSLSSNELIVMHSPTRGTSGVTDETNETLLTSYADSLISLSITEGITFFDVQRYMPRYDVAYSMGIMQDDVHFSDFGAYMFADGLVSVIKPVYPTAPNIWTRNTLLNDLTIQNYDSQNILSLMSESGTAVALFDSSKTAYFYGQVRAEGGDIRLNSNGKARITGNSDGTIEFNAGVGATGGFKVYGFGSNEKFALLANGTLALTSPSIPGEVPFLMRDALGASRWVFENGNARTFLQGYNSLNAVTFKVDPDIGLTLSGSLIGTSLLRDTLSFTTTDTVKVVAVSGGVGTDQYIATARGIYPEAISAVAGNEIVTFYRRSGGVNDLAFTYFRIK